ncbi:MAG: TatD family hydrolase [bacterium]
MARLSDTHFHFTDRPYISCPERVFHLMANHRIHTALVPAYNLESCQRIIALKTTYPSLPVAIGIHPLHLPQNTPITRELIDIYNKIPVSAIGEIGLDKRPGAPALDAQEKAFHEQLILAANWELPVIIHCVRAHDRCLQILKSFFKTKPLKGVIHRISCSIEIAQEYLDLGLYVGLGPDLFDQRRHRLQTLASGVPTDRIVLETDAPYGKNRDGTICNPWEIYDVLDILASLRKISEADLEQIIIQNTFNLLGI